MTSCHPLSWVEGADPDAPAVVDDVSAYSYGELCNRARRLAYRLEAAHGRANHLLIPAERSADFVCLLVASWYSGNVPVPVDPGLPPEALEELGARCGRWATVRAGEVDDQTGTPPLDVRDASLPALILFTSGTSGIPKGVPVSLGNLAHSANVIGEYLGYREHASAAVVLPLHYSYALLSQVLCMFRVGGRSRIFASFRNPLKFTEAVNREGLATFCGVPSTFQALLTLNKLSAMEMPDVRVVCSAGAAFDRGLLPEIKKIFPGATFYDNYGMTEATPRVTFIREDDPRFSEPTCGRPIAGMEIRILAERGLGEVPEGEVGIVAVKGPNVFQGYLHDPQATKRAFTEDGFLLSGDLGYMSGEYLFVCGRRDEVFNVGGEKVSPLEIERVLLQHPSVVACAVASMEDERRGTIPVAYVVLSEAASRRTLKEFLADHLPATKVPWRYFEATTLPTTPNGKLQRRRLAPDATDYVRGELA